MTKLLNWQKRALNRFSEVRLVKTDFVLVAGTGVGKTTSAASMAAYEYNANPDSLIFVACPSRSIKRGWERTFKKFNIACATNPDQVAPDRPVIISTYQGAGKMLHTISQMLNKRKLIIIFDEFHHLEASGEWAKPFLDMSPSSYVRRIFLSGTPWHESGQINLVNYVERDNEKIVEADMTYTYGENVNSEDGDKNTVSIKFEPKKVVIEIENVDKETQEVVGDPVFIDTSNMARSDPITPFVRFNGIDKWQALRRLKSDKFEHVRDLIDRAVVLLRSERKRMNKAGGIIFVSGQSEGGAVQEYLREEHGINALFVISDDPQAHRATEHFESNDDEWIIAIDLIAEGTDIPRLKVGVDLSWKTTMMHIIQRWGRLLRMLRDRYGVALPENIEATLFYVDHPQLRHVAEKIEEDLRRFKKDGGDGGDPPPPGTTEKRVVGAEHEDLNVIYKGDDIDRLVNDIALWMQRTNYNGEGSRIDYRSATWIAKMMVKDGNVPPAFYQSQKEDQQSEDRQKKDQDNSDRDRRWAAAKYDIKHYSSKIAREFYGDDYQASGRAINEYHGGGIYRPWTEKNKTLEQMEDRAMSIKSLYSQLVAGDEDYGD